MNSFARGFTLIELVASIAIAAMLMLGLSGVIGQVLFSGSAVHEQNRLTRDAQFALQKMISAVEKSPGLILPLPDDPATDWSENIRQQTFPASSPEGSSTMATAVLAVRLAQDVDQNGDGVFDADNDGDGLFDEDLPADNQNDGVSGIFLIDDDGDGSIDEDSTSANDDEQLNVADEDPQNGMDDDRDGSIDEDMPADMNGDGCAGLCAVDDNNNGSIDEGVAEDDDEDGASDEDWFDPVVFYLRNGALTWRQPVPWDEDGSGSIDGRDFIETEIANNVLRLRVERVVVVQGKPQQVDILLQLGNTQSGQSITLISRVRVGGAL